MHRSILEQFEELGIEPDDEIVDKCVELCLNYKITDAVEFVEQWMAYSISNLNGAEPTISFLLEFERKELATLIKNLQNIPKRINSVSSCMKNSNHFNISNSLQEFNDINPIALYGNSISNCDVKKKEIERSSNFEIGKIQMDEAIDSYSCLTPKATKTAASKTPTGRHRDDGKFSPASYSPIYGLSKNLAADSGKIVYTFGHSKLINETSWSAAKTTKIVVKNITNIKEPFSNKSKFLFDNLLDKINITCENIFEKGKSICKKHFGQNTTDYDLQHPDIINPDTFKTIGTIFCEHEGLLDKNSTILVGSDDMRLRTVHLNFNKSKPFGIFPGQTVMVSGINPRGDVILVEEFFTERNLLLPQIPKINEEINFVIAAGPFTHADNLVYDPLRDLITYCKENKPHVLILIGPFMNVEHCMINGNVLAETFESYFLKIITEMVEELGPSITICVVASNRDPNSDMVYPTPAINLGKNLTNVYMLPDPCVVDISDIQVGLTATDIFQHILHSELILSAGDKVKRITNYLFHQGSFYPLSPPFDGLCVDTNLASKFAKIERVPHILALPSNHKVFIRDVNGCLTINPGHLADVNGGTFARLVINPTEGKETLFEYMACQIMKV